MTEDHWLDVLARITAHEPVDLNDPAPPAPAQETLPAGPAPAAALWVTQDRGWSCLGVRVTRKPADCARIAARLAAMAIERKVMPVILTPLPESGLEQFGFRVERLPAGDAETQQVFEDELKRFWGMAIVIDAADVGLLA